MLQLFLRLLNLQLLGPQIKPQDLGNLDLYLSVCLHVKFETPEFGDNYKSLHRWGHQAPREILL